MKRRKALKEESKGWKDIKRVGKKRWKDIKNENSRWKESEH
jgi:hypothetical protein